MTSIEASTVSGWRARVLVQLDGTEPAGTMSIVRVDPDGSGHGIMAGQNIAKASGVWEDPEVSLRGQVRYQLRIGSRIWTSNTLTITAPGVILSDPYRGRAVEVARTMEGLESSFSTRSTALDIAGRRDRVVIWDVEGAERVSPQFLTRTDGQARALEMMCRSGDPILVRYPCAGFTDQWLERIGTRTVKRAAARMSSTARLHSLGDCEVLAGPLDPKRRPTGDTLGDLHAAVGGTTLGAIASRWADLGEIALADLKGMI